MRKHLQISGLVSALLLAGGVEAAGLGRLTVQSALGQPLRAEIELVAVQRDEIGSLSARLASAEAFRQARMERAVTLSGLRFEVDQRPDGQPVIKITSAAPINDPFLDLLVELNWNTGRLIREYTLLLDPPADARPRAETSPAPAIVAPLAEPPAQAQAATPATTKAAPAKPAAPARYGPVKAGETLHAIAAKTRPADVTLDQMMVGIYHQNRSAFQGNNMNRLKRGAVLNLPDRDTAMRVDPARASREVRAHANEWIAHQRRLAEAVAAAPPSGVPEAGAGRVTPAPERREATPVAPAEDVLRLSRGEPGTAKTLERIQTLEEELAAKARALQEAQERVAQLERTVKDMQRLLELKAAEVAKPAPTEKTAAPAQAQPQAASPAPAPKATPPAAVAAPMPTPEPETSWLSTFISNPLYIGGLVAAVLLSFLLWMMMVGTRRRKGLSNFEDSIMTGGEFKKEAVFTADMGAAGAPTGGSSLMTDFSRLGLGAIDAHEVDPIAEAEVYMAYGRDTQAEEILKEALSKDPNRHEIALKLLEIYAARKDTNAFEAQASELYASLGGQPSEVWLKAAEMGRSIDPNNPLYRVTPATATSGPTATTAAAAAAATAMAYAEPAPAQPLEFNASTEPAAAPQPAAEPPAAQASASLDFDLGPPSDASAAAEPELADLHLPDSEASEPAAAAPSTPAPNASPDTTALDFNLAPPPTEPTLATDRSDLTVAEVEELELPEAAPSDTPATHPAMEIEVPAATSPAETNLGVPEFDLSGIDLELKEGPVPEIPSGAQTALPGARGEMPGQAAAEAEAPAEIDPEIWEETNTKLDLARAYLEMGDQEGAREILQEVLADGDSRQKEEARKLLVEAA